MHLVLKGTVEKEDLKGLMEPRAFLVRKDYLVRMACQETLESQDQEVHLDQVVQKETKAIKVFLVPLVLQDSPGQKDRVDYLVKWGHKDPRESREWMGQQDQLGSLVFLGQKETLALLVHQAL